MDVGLDLDFDPGPPSGANTAALPTTVTPLPALTPCLECALAPPPPPLPPPPLAPPLLPPTLRGLCHRREGELSRIPGGGDSTPGTLFPAPVPNGPVIRPGRGPGLTSPLTLLTTAG